ncbi:MAG: MFS transporter [Salinisphaera sp.]|jgi:MFS family permease|nr:MFS transporter [Salinisphaera sp.]
MPQPLGDRPLADRQGRSWAIAGIAFIGGLGGGAVFPILPVVGMSLGISDFMIGLILSANRLTRLAFNPVTGTLLDRFGARWPVTAGLLLETVGTLVFCLALRLPHPAAWFLLGRVIWGMGSSLMLVGALAAVMAIASDATRGSMTARVRTAVSLGAPGGLVLGGLVADLVSSSAAFFVASARSLAGALLAPFLVPAQVRRPMERPRLQRSRSASARRRRVDWRRILRVPTLRVIWAANALQFLAVSGVLLATTAVLVEHRALFVFGLDAQGSAGILMAVVIGARGAASLACGSYLDRSTYRTRLLLPAMLLVAVGFVLLGQAMNVEVAVVALLLVGIGSGGLSIPMITLLGDVTPARLQGRALSVYQLSSDFGGAIGPAFGLVLGPLIGYDWVYGLVGVAILGMALPLRILITADKRRLV